MEAFMSVGCPGSFEGNAGQASKTVWRFIVLLKEMSSGAVLSAS
jgi:hypothetical protein